MIDYGELRLILEKQLGITLTIEEAKSIGDELIDFYRILALDLPEDSHSKNQTSSTEADLIDNKKD